MSYVSTARLVVRSYEIDSYRHVNNAVYVQWMEHGRSQLLMDKGLDFHRVEDRFGVRFVTVAVRVDFKAQLVLGDTIEVRTRVARFGRTSVTLEQVIVKLLPDGGERLAALGESTIVFTDRAMAAAAPIPEGFRELYG